MTVRPSGIALMHADVLPDLHRDSALRQRGVQVALDAGEPAGAFAVRRVEGSRERNPIGPGVRERDSVGKLSLERREIRVVDVDRQHAKPVGASARDELRQFAGEVHVHVHLVDSGIIRCRTGRTFVGDRRRREQCRDRRSQRIGAGS